MPKKTGDSRTLKRAKEKLGKLITECRGELSLRQLAAKIELSPSNLLYLENGVNTPTPEIYAKLILGLKPSEKQRKAMDQLYMTIRKVPPPDICETIMSNTELIDALRMVEGQELTPTQMEALKSLFASFSSEHSKGDTENA